MGVTTVTDPRFFSEQQMKDFGNYIQKVVKPLHKDDKPIQRDSGTIKRELAGWVGTVEGTGGLGIEGRLPRQKRLLANARQHREEVLASISRCEKTVEELRKAGVNERDSRIQKFTGYDFPSRTTGGKGHKNGAIENLREELTRTEKQIDQLASGLANLEAQVKEIVPALEKELKAALKLDGLS